jgi:hypothetical protein
VNALPLRRACELERCPEERKWLVEGLWSERAVGIVGGEPKCCKSFLALDFAVAVASGTPCLRRFAVKQKGPVIVFAAEDAQHEVRARLEGISRAAGVPFDELDVHVITAPIVRLDLEDDCRKLSATVEAVRPKLLVLDPFVRLHRQDENVAADVAPLLGYLRQIERQFHAAVLLVHHARKGAAHLRGGQALRGSSELHAWGDSNVYIRRKGDDLLLMSAEHRAAAPIREVALELRVRGEVRTLEVVDQPIESDETRTTLSVAERIEQALSEAVKPLAIQQLRKASRMRMESLCDALAELTADGRVVKCADGYQLASNA